MFWPIRWRDNTDIHKLVRVNDRVQLEVFGKRYLSRVEDIRPGEMEVAAPFSGGSPVTLWPGQEVMLSIFGGAGVRQFAAAVKAARYDRVPVVTLARFRSKGVIQHRSYSRVEDELLVRFRKEEGPDNPAPWRRAITRDVSAGGAHVAAEDVWTLSVGDLVEVEVLLPNDRPVPSVAQVVRLEAAQVGTWRTLLALTFVEMDPSDRSRIVNYVDRRKSELASARSAFVRCTEYLPTQYRKKSAGKDVSAWRTGSARDVSASSLRMIVPDVSHINAGDTLDLCVALPEQHRRAEAECEVVWIRPVPKSEAGSFEIGVRFVAISPAARAAILAFVSEAKHGATVPDEEAA